MIPVAELLYWVAPEYSTEQSNLEYKVATNYLVDSMVQYGKRP